MWLCCFLNIEQPVTGLVNSFPELQLKSGYFLVQFDSNLAISPVMWLDYKTRYGLLAVKLYCIRNNLFNDDGGIDAVALEKNIGDIKI